MNFLQKMFCILLAVSCLSITACDSGSPPEPARAQEDLTAEILGEAMVAVSGAKDTLTPLNELVMLNLYDFDPAFSDDYRVYYDLTGSSIDEIAVFHASNADAKKELEEMLQGRIETIRATMELDPGNYEAELKMLENSKILVSGDYIALVITTDVGAVEKAFKDNF